jgi:DNA mismatch repair protein MutS2
MLYPSNLEEKLGFSKLRTLLEEKCESSLGQQYVKKISFSTKKESIEEWLEQTREFVEVINSGALFPNSNYIDISKYFPKIKVSNAFLTEEEFFDLILSLKTLDKCLDFFKVHRAAYPMLSALTHPVIFNDDLLWSLDRLFDERGKLKDNASDRLFEIRKGIQQERQRLRKVLDRILSNAKKEDYTNDDVGITIRDGRMVIPILAEHKRRIKGFIHGESATGQTVYLEPTEVLEINNEVKELEYSEKREMMRILTEQTDLVRYELENLGGAMQFLGLIDFIRAKARLAQTLEATKPLWSEGKAFKWFAARHPNLFINHLAQNKETVPLTISLDHQSRILVISGPNAGGKSVCLKTVGLVQYMFQCGLLVPVDESSEFMLFKDLFIDIGDEQSIENDLSTYSSHLVNMKHLLAHVNKKSLVLIDEFGTGTEPQYGGAIAEAILSELEQSKAMGVITTHYGNLKEFAERQPGLVNGAMRYDLDRLQPLYQLEMGKPGSSFALEIAQKIGLPKPTLERAKKRVGKKLVSYDRMLAQLDQERQQFDQTKKEIKNREAELQELTAQYQELKSHLEAREKRMLNKAKQEAADIVKQANKEVERVIREIKEAKAKQEVVKQKRKELESFKEKQKPQRIEQPDEIKAVEGEITVGDYARVKGQTTVGLVAKIKGKDAELQIGALSSIVKLNRLEKVSKKSFKKQNDPTASKSLDMTAKMSSFNHKLDIRGRRAEEVIPILDKWIDEAILLGAKEIQVLHGTGNGVLRQVTRNYLSAVKEVKSFKDEHVERGGSGITLIYFQ